jgi:hypothetical protein
MLGFFICFWLYALDYFNRRFRVAKKLDTLSGFFLLYENLPSAITTLKKSFFTLKIKKFYIFPLFFDFFKL